MPPPDPLTGRVRRLPRAGRWAPEAHPPHGASSARGAASPKAGTSSCRCPAVAHRLVRPTRAQPPTWFGATRQLLPTRHSLRTGWSPCYHDPAGHLLSARSAPHRPARRCPSHSLLLENLVLQLILGVGVGTASEMGFLELGHPLGSQKREPCRWWWVKCGKPQPAPGRILSASAGLERDDASVEGAMGAPAQASEKIWRSEFKDHRTEWILPGIMEEKDCSTGDKDIGLLDGHTAASTKCKYLSFE